MHLFVNTRGAGVRVEEGLLAVELPDRVVRLSPNKVGLLALGPSASLTTPVMALCLRHGVELLLMDRDGNPTGRFWHSGQSAWVEARRQQLLAAADGRGPALAGRWIAEKLRGQAGVLYRLLKTRRGSEDLVGPRVRALYSLAARAESPAARPDPGARLLGIEGAAGRLYFGCLSALLPGPWRFARRSRRPARDGFNCLLNYAYGILYSLVERSVLLAGLDPYGGFLHAEGGGRLSLVYDLMERYRHWAELSVFRLFSGRRARPEDFRQVDGGVALEDSGRRLAAEAVGRRLDVVVRHGGRNRKLRDTVLYDCHALAAELAGRELRQEDIEAVEL